MPPMKPKRLPRLWCALQGLLPLDACLAAQRGELAWPNESGEAESLEPESQVREAGDKRERARPLGRVSRRLRE